MGIKKLSWHKNPCKACKRISYNCNQNWNKRQSILKWRWNKCLWTKLRLMFWNKVFKKNRPLWRLLLTKPMLLKLNVKLNWLRLCLPWELLKMPWKFLVRNNWINWRQWRNHLMLSEWSWKHYACWSILSQTKKLKIHKLSKLKSIGGLLQWKC